VANCGNNSVRADPLAGGNASVVIGSTSFNCPRGIAFDSAGNLWVANRSGSAVRFPNAQIAATNGGAMPDVTLPAPSGGTQPFGVALDKDGNVWVAFCGGSKVARYTNGAFTAAAAVLSQDATQQPLNLDCPVGLALDKSGRLWVGNRGTAAGSGTLSVFSTTDMASSGSPSALTELTNIGITVGGLAFNPTAVNLPIRH
jgi:streptogramin lyase